MSSKNFYGLSQTSMSCSFLDCFGHALLLLQCPVEVSSVNFHVFLKIKLAFLFCFFFGLPVPFCVSYSNALSLPGGELSEFSYSYSNLHILFILVCLLHRAFLISIHCG